MRRRWYRIWRFLPVPLFEVASMKVGNAAARGPFMQVDTANWNNAPIIQHELTHVRQFWRSLMLHGIMYGAWPWYRLHAEAEACAEELRWIPREEFWPSVKEFARNLTKLYHLNVTYVEAHCTIVAWWDKNPRWYV
jgi:hypothetical protein